jgi:hypothetical protein
MMAAGTAVMQQHNAEQWSRPTSGQCGLLAGFACTALLIHAYALVLPCRFDWSAEVARAKALIAAGEAEFEIEDDVYDPDVESKWGGWEL